jgi:hypothetical protein
MGYNSFDVEVFAVSALLSLGFSSEEKPLKKICIKADVNHIPTISVDITQQTAC